MRAFDRYSKTGGDTGDKVGSMQNDALIDHPHDYIDYRKAARPSGKHLGAGAEELRKKTLPAKNLKEKPASETSTSTGSSKRSKSEIGRRLAGNSLSRPAFCLRCYSSKFIIR